MGNNPVSGVDPDGRRRIYYNEDGTYNRTERNNFLHNFLFGDVFFVADIWDGYTEISKSYFFNVWQADLFPQAFGSNATDWNSGFGNTARSEINPFSRTPTGRGALKTPMVDPIDLVAGGLSASRKIVAKAGVGLTDDAARILSKADYLRIQNASTRINKPIHVVGSRATGRAGSYSDWDYVIEGLNNNSWKKIKNSLPGSKSIFDNKPKNIDIFKTLDHTKPHITIHPKI